MRQMEKKRLRFKMEDGSREKLQKRIDEHIQRGGKQISDIHSYQSFKKYFKPTGYGKMPFNFDSYDDNTRFRVFMEYGGS